MRRKPRILVLLHIIVIMAVIGVTPSCSGGKSGTESRRQLIEVYDSAENTIRDEGDYPHSLELYLSFIRGAENDPALESRLMRAYVSVAVIYASFSDMEHAIVYNKLAYPLARRLGDTRFAELSLTNLAHIYMEMGNFLEASAMADSLLALDAADSRTLMFHHSMIRGKVAQHDACYQESLGYFRKADSAANHARLSNYERSAPPGLIAGYYEMANMPDSQLFYLNKEWQLLENDKDPQPRAESARRLMIFHTAHGNLEEARRFQREYFSLTDSLVNVRQFMSVNARHQQSEIDSRGLQIDTLSRESSHQRTIIVVISLLLVLAVAFIIVIISQKRRLDAAYKALFDKDRQLMGIVPDRHEQEPQNEDPEIAEEPEEDMACVDSDPKEEERNRTLYDRIVAGMDATRDWLSPDFGLGNVVAMAGSNVAYVSKVVKLYSGQNVPAFINEYRIREACRRILDEDNYGNITFAAIGESVGFSSQVSFNRTFKKVTGITPSLYRKMASEEHRKV